MNLIKEHKFFYKEIKKRKQEFLENRNKKIKIFKELCFCILTPQSKAKNCWHAVEELFRKKFPYIRKKTVENILKRNVRFYKNKTKYLFDLAKRFNIIYKIINLHFEEKVLREILTREIKGLGYKEASHFLRNIGYSFDLAILDRHILRNLYQLKVINKIPEKLSKSEYLRIEEKFIKFSKKIKIPLVDLDLLFWAKQTGFVFK